MDFVLNLLQFLGLLVTVTRGLASQVKEAEFELSVSYETTDNEPLQDETLELNKILCQVAIYWLSYMEQDAEIMLFFVLV